MTKNVLYEFLIGTRIHTKKQYALHDFQQIYPNFAAYIQAVYMWSKRPKLWVSFSQSLLYVFKASTATFYIIGMCVSRI